MPNDRRHLAERQTQDVTPRTAQNACPQFPSWNGLEAHRVTENADLTQCVCLIAE